MEDKIKNIKKLSDISSAASSKRRNALSKLEDETLDRTIKEGMFNDREFYVSKHNELVFETMDINVPLHKDLSAVLDLTHTTMVHHIYHWQVLDSKRKVQLRIGRFKATIRLPEEMSKNEFKTICEYFGINKIDGGGLEYSLNNTKKELKNYLAIEKIKKELDTK